MKVLQHQNNTATRLKVQFKEQSTTLAKKKPKWNDNENKVIIFLSYL